MQSVGTKAYNLEVTSMNEESKASAENVPVNRVVMCETETIDKLYLELSQFTKAKTKNDILLERLLMAVETKHPNQTRFETALMYIEQAESSSNGIAEENT